VLIVYIAEAHAADVWPINSTRCSGPGNSVLTPTSLEERSAVAERMVESLKLRGTHVSVLVDGMDDAFLETYASWPIRLYGVSRAARLERIASPKAATFELASFRLWLLEQCDAMQGQGAY